MEIIIKSVLYYEYGSGDYAMIGHEGLDLPTTSEIIEATMNKSGIKHIPYTIAVFGYHFKIDELNK